jgi:hypothetical protein
MMKPAISVKAVLPIVGIPMLMMIVSCKGTNSLQEVKTIFQPPAPIYSGATGTSSVQRSDLITLPANYTKGSVAFSPEGKHYAFVVGASGTQRVVLDGVESPEFKACSFPIFSKAGKLFFWGVKEGKIVLSADGRIIPTSFAGEGTVVFSKDGAPWAAYGSEQVKHNGNSIYPGIVVMFLDGVELGRYDDVGLPEFSRDGKHLAFLARDGGQMILVVDGKVSSRFDKPKVNSSKAFSLFVNGPSMFLYTSLYYLNDGGIFALAEDANGWTVYKEGNALTSYLQNVWGGGEYTLILNKGFEDAASIYGRSLAVAEDAPVVAWWERPSGKGAFWRVVVDGKPADAITSPDFWSPQPLVLSHDGKRIAYAANFASGGAKKPEVYVIVDGVKNGPYAHVWGIRFSDDAKHFAYAASDGSSGDAWSYYLDGKRFGQKYSAVYPPVFSANGRHVAWQATRNNKLELTLDGEDIGTTEEVLWGPEIQAAGASSWAVREGAKVIKITTTIK